MTDEELIDVVRAAFETYESVPESVLAAAAGAFRWRTGEASLARLVEDNRELPAGSRGEASRLLTFAGTDLAVEIEVTGTGRSREIAGRLHPAAPAEVSVRCPGGQLTAYTDGTGEFVAPDVPSGLVSLLFRLDDGTSIVTSWIRL